MITTCWKTQSLGSFPDRGKTSVLHRVHTSCGSNPISYLTSDYLSLGNTAGS